MKLLPTSQAYCWYQAFAFSTDHCRVSEVAVVEDSKYINKKGRAKFMRRMTPPMHGWQNRRLHVAMRLERYWVPSPSGSNRRLGAAIDRQNAPSLYLPKGR